MKRGSVVRIAEALSELLKQIINTRGYVITAIAAETTTKIPITAFIASQLDTRISTRLV